MNKIFSIVWNASLGCWVAASELARKKTKGRARKNLGKVSTLAACLSIGVMSSFANAGTAVQLDQVGNGTATGAGATAPATADTFSIAIGGGSGATATGISVSIGDASKATGTSSTALGRQSTATGNNSVALGREASSAGLNSTAIGWAANASASSGIAIGPTATASGFRAIALGDNARGLGSDSVAIGAGAAASNLGSMALGNFASVQTDNSIALGDHSVAQAAVASTGGVINGTNFTYAGGAPIGVLSLGTAGNERQITNVAAGQVSAASTDAVNGSQLFATNTSVNSLGAAINSMTSGAGIKYFHVNSALADSTAAGVNATAVGPNAQAINASDTAIGVNATANGGGSFAAGASSLASGDSALALGSGATSSNTGAVALGANSTTSAAVATTGTTLNGTAYTFAGAAPSSVVSVGSAGAERQITNVAAGQITANSTDAVNGSQLFATNSAITSLNNGAGIKYFHANSVLADSTASGTDSVAVGPASSASADNAVAVGKGAVSSTANSVALGNDAVTALANATASGTVNGTTYNYAGAVPVGVVSVGSAGNERQITNVAAGQVAATSTDAVNGSQLFATNSAVNSLGGRVATVENSIVNITNGAGVKYFHSNSTQADSVASGNDAVAIGPNAQASGASSVAVGNGASASAAGSVALGQGASDNGRGAETYTGKYSNASNVTSGTVSVGNAATGETRTLSNVADGRQATDAVNVRQLDGAVAQANQYTDNAVSGISASAAQTNTRVTQVEGDVSNLKNGTDGMFQVNNSSAQPKPQAAGADSLAGGAGSVASGKNSAAVGTQAHAVGANSTAVGNGAKASGKNATALGANALADRDNSVSVGSAGNERQITNVAAGTSATDAVNLDQLNKSVSALTNNANAYTDQRYNDLKRDLKEQDNVLSAGIASAMAMASLPQPYAPGASMTAAGMSTYRGQSSMAVGVSHISNNGRWVSKLQGSTDTQGSFGVAVGVGYQW